MIRCLIALAAAACLCGCATHYVTPSGRADFAAFTSQSIKESFAATPATRFPAYIAVVRVQAPRYHSYLTDREGGVYGQGRYSIVTTRSVEDDADFQRLSGLMQVGGLVSLNALLLPQKLDSDRELREAAARLKADMVLLYTFDTSFHENNSSAALTTISLGLAPTRNVFVHVTASALLIDTRTGFIYGAIESNEHRRMITSAWVSQDAADRARLDAEKTAFGQLISELEKTWPRIIERAGKGA